MKKSMIVIVALMIGIAFSGINPINVEANKKEISYKNCKALNADYKYGVKKSKEIKNKVINRNTKKATFKTSNAHASASLYKLNSHLDNDNDGIACEK